MDESIHVPTYEQMVKRLFKKSIGHGAAMMHAAIGIAGETGELKQADNRKNFLEECGDMEFYIEAAWQQIAERKDLENGAVSFQESLFTNVNMGNVLGRIHLTASELLDHAKKCWVYEDGNRDDAIAVHLQVLSYLLQRMYEMTGTSREEVRGLNQVKLMKRYSSGTYSNQQALARADKVEEAGATRNFIGKA